jgi:hypothetical protein
MFDRHLVTDVAIAAAIVLPAALPPSATPRGPDTQLVSAAPSPTSALAENGTRLSWANAGALQGRS